VACMIFVHLQFLKDIADLSALQKQGRLHINFPMQNTCA